MDNCDSEVILARREWRMTSRTQRKEEDKPVTITESGISGTEMDKLGLKSRTQLEYPACSMDFTQKHLKENILSSISSGTVWGTAVGGMTVNREGLLPTTDGAILSISSKGMSLHSTHWWEPWELPPYCPKPRVYRIHLHLLYMVSVCSTVWGLCFRHELPDICMSSSWPIRIPCGHMTSWFVWGSPEASFTDNLSCFKKAPFELKLYLSHAYTVRRKGNYLWDF